MFKIFNLDFKEYPYVDIKIWEWCPASCTDCRFNLDYMKKTKQFSLDNILNRISLVDKKFEKSFNLVFWNQDILNHKDIIEIIRAWLLTGREIRFQIDFDIKKEHLLLLKKIENEFGVDKIDIKIAKNTRLIENNLAERLMVLIKLLSKNTNFKVFIDLFIDFEKQWNIANSFYNKFSNNVSENEYNFNIWKNINLKFHNYSWYLDRKNKCFVNMPRTSCQQLEQIKLENNNIFLKDSLDVYDNWDLFLHDNLCNIWDIRISNLYLDDNEIYNNFTLYLEHLNKLKSKHNNQSDMCFECTRKWFKYPKN